MATARDLLRQADALMRRNRLRDADDAGEVPVLTDVVAAAGEDVAPGTERAERAAVAEAPSDADDVPLLTEIVEDYEPISIIGEPATADDAAQWSDFDDGEVVIVESSPTAETAAPAAERDSYDAGAAQAPVAPPGDAESEAARWDALAEEVRMQVLQRIDIFTDTGLQEQLTERLQPIVDRASADLVATINQQVGQLLRGYVAEAIEREIEKWRRGDA